jgi:hypothetical protein
MGKVPKSDILKKNLISALESSLGIVTKACKNVGCSRKTFYQYYAEDEEFAGEVDLIGEMALDFAESSLHKQIQEGVPTSTIFYLKTKGKKRGYIESIEHLGNKDKPLRTTIEFGGQKIEI